jgi:ribosome recycling factor
MIDSLQKDGDVGEDDADRARKELEEVVKGGTQKVDAIVTKKEADILEV